ncbi:D-alanine--D-alanine ligase [Sinorhizobium medicae]|uniref:D-alanine--D-alanine ligase n=1 Tax=Sinorhizobium medicae TaxID=110321 RepID=UPI000FD6DE74|nr:D-alanine--D-alanine ligase [Sinorhizobium medicae]RVJ66983.1 D-alanine--D-alanine ligase [Sinorhizobium medicae]
MHPSVSLIFGGRSSEYEASVSSCSNIISSYIAIPIEDRPFPIKHIYHVRPNDGRVSTTQFKTTLEAHELPRYISEICLVPGDKLYETFDLISSREEYIVNLLHGQFGEDGGVQTLAALSGLNGTFGDPYVASLAINKFAMSSFVAALLSADIVRVPKTHLIKPQQMHDAIRISSSFRLPIIVKPNSLGSSQFTALFQDALASKEKIVHLLARIFEYDSSALLQEFIPGSEYSCGCLVSSSDVIALPVMMVENPRNHFDAHEKSNLTATKALDKDDAIGNILASISTVIASAVGICNIARFHFRVTERYEVYFLECNYIPALGSDSIFNQMLHHYGMTVIDLISFMALSSNSYARKAHPTMPYWIEG